jgi:hypothetical protein
LVIDGLYTHGPLHEIATSQQSLSTMTNLQPHMYVGRLPRVQRIDFPSWRSRHSRVVSFSALSLVEVPGALCASRKDPSDATTRRLSGQMERVCPDATRPRLWADAGPHTCVADGQ